jgi:PAS domain S-box-containing protein
MQLGQVISANLGLAEVLQTAYVCVGKLMPNEAFWIASYQPGSEQYQYLIVIDRGESYPLTHRSIEHGVGGYVIRTGQPLMMRDPASQKLFPVARFGSPDPIRSVLCVPLCIGDRLVGIMSTQSYDIKAYTKADLDLLVKLAQPVAIALENAQLYQAVQQRAQELSQANERLQQEIVKREEAEVALRKHQEQLEEQVIVRTAELSQTNCELQREITERIQAEEKRSAHERFLTLLNDITFTALQTSTLQEMLQTLADRLGELIQADGCYITLWDEASQKTIPAAASGEVRGNYPSFQVEPDDRTLTQSVLEAGHALVAEDVFNTPYLSPRIAARFSTRSILALPLIGHNQRLGAALIGFDTLHHFTPAEIAYCEQAAQQVALAVAKARLFEALKESEKRYYDLFQYATDAIFIETLAGDILAVNEQACQLLGYTEAELLALKVADIILPLSPTENDSIRVALKENRPVVVEAQNRRKDGSLVDVEVSMRLIDLEDQEIAQVFVRDITERKRAEKALRESEERFRATFEHAGVGIAHLDLEGRWLRINQKLADMIGYSREELRHKRFQDITHPADLEADLEYTRQMLAFEISTYTLEKRYIHQSGSLVWANLTVSLVRAPSGEPDYFIAVIEDITRRKQLEEQLQQLKRIEAVSVLAGGIAHDFNNLLTVITGNCEMILNSADLDDQTRQDVEKINKAGGRAATLISQLLAFSRQQVLLPKVANLNRLLVNIEPILRQLIAQNIELTIHLEPSLGLVKVDPGQFEQVIISLVSNACDAMPQGGQLVLETNNVHLDEEAVKQYINLRPGHYVRLAISDTGSGMDHITQAHLFEPFFTTKEVGKGIGLGLAMVHGIIKQSEGYIHFHTEPHKGTTFSIFLPGIDPKKAF